MISRSSRKCKRSWSNLRNKKNEKKISKILTPCHIGWVRTVPIKLGIEFGPVEAGPKHEPGELLSITGLTGARFVIFVGLLIDIPINEETSNPK